MYGLAFVMGLVGSLHCVVMCGPLVELFSGKNQSNWLLKRLLYHLGRLAMYAFLGMLIGKIADSVNHLVFTMPFLPSEGNKVKMLIDGELKDVVQFHYLPYLWYKYPIPLNLREFWYSERPDILNFMERNYGQFGINFRPLLSGSEVSPILDSTGLTDSLIIHSKDFFGLL